MLRRLSLGRLLNEKQKNCTCLASEGELAEALTFAMFHGGAPCFVNACDKWRRLILAGDVPATEPYRAWAEMPGQGGYDEAAGLTAQSN